MNTFPQHFKERTDDSLLSYLDPGLSEDYEPREVERFFEDMLHHFDVTGNGEVLEIILTRLEKHSCYLTHSYEFGKQYLKDLYRVILSSDFWKNDLLIGRYSQIVLSFDKVVSKN